MILTTIALCFLVLGLQIKVHSLQKRIEKLESKREATGN